MQFERGKNIKASLGVGMRGTILETFKDQNFIFQRPIVDHMITNPSSWTYRKRSWRKRLYYFIITDYPGKYEGKKDNKVYSYYIPFAENKVALFHKTKASLREEARRLINRTFGLPYEPAKLVKPELS
jgi:hypothetical protein